MSSIILLITCSLPYNCSLSMKISSLSNTKYIFCTLAILEINNTSLQNISHILLAVYLALEDTGGGKSND